MGNTGPTTGRIRMQISAYAKSKTLAERAAWKAVEASAMELAVVVHGGVFGPF